MTILVTMNNKGVEIDLKYIPVKTRNVTWNIGFNATHYRNKISRLAESKKTDIIDGHAGYVNGLYYYGEGLPMYTNYCSKICRCVRRRQTTMVLYR